jgi:hypothetical protein
MLKMETGNSSKRWYLYTKLHGFIFHKTKVFTRTAVTTSDNPKNLNIGLKFS